MQLASEEAEQLAIAIQKVNEQYDTVMNPKVMAWAQLALVAGSIYGTRIYTIRARHMAAMASKPQPIQMGPAMGPVKVDAKTKPNGVFADSKTPAELFGLNYSGALQGAAPDVV